ncbi:MAG: CBS domain-containing protein [Chloroflexi bacterium]|nr:CBS domain-containing protein [Chloroflexota bacterium]
MAVNSIAATTINTLNARDVMNTPVVAALPKASVREVATYMLLGGFSGLPIVDEDGTILGIVTELDILRTLRARKPLDTTSVSEIMTPEVISVEPSTPVDQIMRTLDSEHIQRLPVVKDERIIGVVSRPDIMRAAVNPQLKRLG